MRSSPRIKRRRFLGLGLGVVSSSALSSCGRAGGGPYWRSFRPEEARTVEAITDCIIPKDDFPGAVEAGVVHYIDRQLAGHFRKHREAYRRLVATIDRMAREKAGKLFADLEFENRVELLTHFEEAHPDLFELVRSHTMQGFYGDPRHGGNRNAVSWRMLGLPDPPVRGRLPFETGKG